MGLRNLWCVRVLCGVVAVLGLGVGSGAGGGTAQAGSGIELRWAERETAASLAARGLRTVRLYARQPEVGARLLLVGAGRSAATGGVAGGGLHFSGPVWNDPMGGDLGVEGAGLLSAALASDSFLMLGEVGGVNVSTVRVGGGGSARVAWDTGLDMVWHTSGTARGVVSPGDFGDGDEWVAVLQVTLPLSAEAAGEMVLGWDTGRRSDRVVVVEVPSIGASLTGETDGGGAGVGVDVTGDGVVDAADVVGVLVGWGGAGGDVDGDGVAGAVDVGLVLAAQGLDRGAFSDAAWQREVPRYFTRKLRSALRAVPRGERVVLTQRFFEVLSLESLESSAVAGGSSGPDESGEGGAGGASNADVNSDGAVDVRDAAAVLGAWGFASGDADGDGVTGESDLRVVLRALGYDPAGKTRRAWTSEVMPLYTGGLRDLIRRLPGSAGRAAPGRLFGLAGG